MNGAQGLFLATLPDLNNLCCVKLLFPDSLDEGQLRSQQLKTSRDLLFFHMDFVVSPVLGDFGGIVVVMSNAQYRKGIIQAFVLRNGLKLSFQQDVSPTVLQMCLSYSVVAKLAPNWNKAGPYLIAGKDFICDSGKLNAVVLEVNVTERQLCVHVESNLVRLPPVKMMDFDCTASVRNKFLHNEDVSYSTMTNNWCHILPSMKKGQIISVSRRIPPECPFQSYEEFQKHWNSVYGYELPEESADEVIYCSVYFKPLGDKLFTYPLCCVRSQPVQCFPRFHRQGVLGSFLSDLQAALKSVCGFPMQTTTKPFYPHCALIKPVSQCFRSQPQNVASESTSVTFLNPFPSSCSENPVQHHSTQHDSTGDPAKKSWKKLETCLVSSVDQRDWTFCNSASLSSDSSSHLSSSHSVAGFSRMTSVPVVKNTLHTQHVNALKTGGKQPRGLEILTVMTTLSSQSFTPVPSSSKLPSSTQPAVPIRFSRPTSVQVSLPISIIKQTTKKDPQQFSDQTPTQSIAEFPRHREDDLFEPKPKRLKQIVQDVENNKILLK